jgi:hypothetical protein
MVSFRGTKMRPLPLFISAFFGRLVLKFRAEFFLRDHVLRVDHQMVR